MFEQLINRQRRGGKLSSLEQGSGALFAVTGGRLRKPHHLIPKPERFGVIQTGRQPGGALQRTIAERVELERGAIRIGGFQKILLPHELLGARGQRIRAFRFQPTIGRPQREQGREQQHDERDPKEPPASFADAVEMTSSAALFIHSRRDIQTSISKSLPHTVPRALRKNRKEKIPIDSTTEN